MTNTSETRGILTQLNLAPGDTMGDYNQLKVWERAHELVLAVYRSTETFPASERVGLAGQLRRASISIASNIVEGSSRRGDGEFGRFLSIARGSAAEVAYQLLLARDLGFLSSEQWEQLDGLAQEVGRMLYGLTKAIRKSAAK